VHRLGWCLERGTAGEDHDGRIVDNPATIFQVSADHVEDARPDPGDGGEVGREGRVDERPLPSGAIERDGLHLASPRVAKDRGGIVSCPMARAWLWAAARRSHVTMATSS
jgi:hypothetical protein